MGRIKVLHIIGGGEFGGAEEYLLTLLRHVDPQIYELHTACLFPEPLAPLVREKGFPAHVFPMRSKLDISPVSKMASLIKTEGFHIVHTHGVRANLLGRLAARQAGVTHVITTVHSVLAFDYPGLMSRVVNSLCERGTRGITEYFITISDMLADLLAAQGVARQKITTVHNGLELEKYDPAVSGESVRREFAISAGTPVIGIVARLHPVKGHICLLQALVPVIRRHPDLKLLVIGTGPYRDRLEESVAALGLKANVVFTGFRRDIPAVLAALDLLVVPSVSEGLGLTVMEGMAMKRPVLAFAVGGIPEIITSGVDGLLVPPADIPALSAGIEQILASPETAARLGSQARKTIETRFTAGLMAERTAQLYHEILKDGEL